jgi:hypothetical protein
VRLHGTSSYSFPRKSYTLETWGETDDNGRDVALLGMPADNDWVLYAPSPANYNASFIHNSFIYELAAQSGYPASRVRFVEVFLNTNGTDLALSHNLGLYILLEKVKRAKDRVDCEPFATNGTIHFTTDGSDPRAPGELFESEPRHTWHWFRHGRVPGRVEPDLHCAVHRRSPGRILAAFRRRACVFHEPN